MQVFNLGIIDIGFKINIGRKCNKYDSRNRNVIQHELDIRKC